MVQVVVDTLVTDLSKGGLIKAAKPAEVTGKDINFKRKMKNDVFLDVNLDDLEVVNNIIACKIGRLRIIWVFI